jgi:ribosome-associated protein
LRPAWWLVGMALRWACPVIGFDLQKDYPRQMRTATGATRKGKPSARVTSEGRPSAALVGRIVEWLDDAKAEDIVTIDLDGKSAMSDFMVIATGRSDRHVGAIADQILKKLKEDGWSRARIEGQPQCDWVLIDTGDIIVHVFRPEVREFYNLEKMWSQDRPPDTSTH